MLPGMVSWLKSQTNMFQAKKRRRVDNAEDFDDFSLLAIVKDDEIRHMREIEKKNRIYSNDELSSISVGDYVILRGFPFEGLPATILSINYNKRTIGIRKYNRKVMMKLYEEMAWDVLDELEKSVLILCLTHGKSVREVGSIIKKPHYTCLKVKTRAENIFKIMMAHYYNYEALFSPKSPTSNDFRTYRESI